MKKFCFIIGKILSVIFPLKIKYLFEGIVRLIYTGYFSRFFKSFGEDSRVSVGSHFEGLQYISIGGQSTLDRGILTAYKSDTYREEAVEPLIKIGDHCCLGKYFHITACNKIIIGDNLLAGPNVLITDNSHGNTDYNSLKLPPLKRQVISNGPVVIGKNVWIGEKASILPNVTIGDGAVIAANSVVTKDIPPFSVAAGCPAKIIKERNN